MCIKKLLIGLCAFSICFITGCQNSDNLTSDNTLYETTQKNTLQMQPSTQNTTNEVNNNDFVKNKLSEIVTADSDVSLNVGSNNTSLITYNIGNATIFGDDLICGSLTKDNQNYSIIYKNNGDIVFDASCFLNENIVKANIGGFFDDYSLLVLCNKNSEESYYIVNIKTKEKVELNSEYKPIDFAYGYIIVGDKNTHKMGMLDIKQNEIIKTEYDNMFFLSDSRLGAVKGTDGNTAKVEMIDFNNKLLSNKDYKGIYDFRGYQPSGGGEYNIEQKENFNRYTLAITTVEGHAVVIDENGKEVLSIDDLQYLRTRIIWECNDEAYVGYVDNNSYYKVINIKTGVIEKNEKYASESGIISGYNIQYKVQDGNEEKKIVDIQGNLIYQASKNEYIQGTVDQRGTFLIKNGEQYCVYNVLGDILYQSNEEIKQLGNGFYLVKNKILLG